MNRKWIYRAVSAAVLAGGMLFAAATTASAGIPVAGSSTSGATPHHVLAPASFAHPVGTRDGMDGTVHTLPYRTGQSPVYVEAGSTTAMPAMPSGNTPTSGMSVDGGKLLSATGGLVQPVQQLGGPAAGPLSSLTGGSEASTLPIPLSAPTQVLPVSATEGGFTVGQGNQLPGTSLVNQVGSSAGSTVGQLVGGPAGAAMPQGPTGESATDPVSNTAGGTDVAGLPLNMVTDPVTSQLSGEADQTGAAAQPAAPTTGQPAEPAAPTASGDPLSTVTGLLGGIG